jgi:hypothetical protein
MPELAVHSVAVWRGFSRLSEGSAPTTGTRGKRPV